MIDIYMVFRQTRATHGAASSNINLATPNKFVCQKISRDTNDKKNYHWIIFFNAFTL
jgi:hypothetical protein